MNKYNFQIAKGIAEVIFEWLSLCIYIEASYCLNKDDYKVTEAHVYT